MIYVWQVCKMIHPDKCDAERANEATQVLTNAYAMAAPKADPPTAD